MSAEAPPGPCRREWVEPDGLGGYAMGNALLLPTRRYHGLLTVARRPPVDRRVLVNALEERVETPHAAYRIDSLTRVEGADSAGWRHLEESARDPFPRFVYRLGAHRIERVVGVAPGAAAVVVRYRHLAGPAPLSVLVSPLLSGRSAHDLSRENPLARADPSRRDGDWYFRPYEEEPGFYLRAPGCRYHPGASWVRGVIYEREAARGYPSREDLLSPGHLEFELAPGEDRAVAFSAAPLGPPDPAAVLAAERDRRAGLAPPGAHPDLAALARAAEAFRARRPPDGATVLAGFPWFEDWGRDTFISLPGLALGDPDFALRVLETAAQHRVGGKIPNRFGERPGEAEYAAADASLWFAHEFGRLREALPGRDLDEPWRALREIFERYLGGTRHGIGIDPADGLLVADAPGRPLTWMDARFDDQVVTPRAGKPVELQGLWHSACRVVEAEAARRGDRALGDRARKAADAARAAFAPTFWLEGPGYFADVIRPDGTPDPALRPNQVIALGLRHRLAPAGLAARALDAVDRELLTPYGLRTLSPGHPEYRGRYAGDLPTRDRAYHQGTVWPWLLGPYARACLRARGPRQRARLRRLIEPLLAWLRGDGMGSLPEVFDGDPPHDPGGCPAQAWSVAAVRELRHRLEEPVAEPYDPVEP